MVNPLREPGLDRYWVPSSVESAMFGTHMTDEFFAVNTGGDLAFVNGVLKVMLAEGTVDRDFVRDHTDGFDDVVAELDRESFADLERQSGATRADMERFARMYADAHVGGAHLVDGDHPARARRRQRRRDRQPRARAGQRRSARARGSCPSVAIPGCRAAPRWAPTPPRSRAGSTINAANAAALAEQYGFPVGDRPGITAEEMVEAGGRGELDVLYSSGGNFLEVLPDPDVVEEALARVPLRVHQDIVLSSQMFVDAGRGRRAPARGHPLRAARRRHRDHHRAAHRVQSRRSPDRARVRCAASGRSSSTSRRRVAPERAEQCSFASGQEIRDEIARVVPVYSGVELLRTTGDAVQWGGTRLCEGGTFPTPDGRARFLAVAPFEADVPAGSFVLSTRRGKQFNTMVHEQTGPAHRRDA